MLDPAILNYVKAAGALLGIPMDDARAARVADHLARTADMAAALEAVALSPADEPDTLYGPAPFPAPATDAAGVTP